MRVASFALFISVCACVSAYGWNDEQFSGNDTFVEGDMFVERNVRSTHTYGIPAASVGKWPGGVVPYIIAGNIGMKGRMQIRKAMHQYHCFTCIRFVPRTNEKAYIRISADEAGCWASIGYHAQVSQVNLGGGSSCQDYGTIMHEFAHVLGFKHEHNRPDRNKYIKILWNNIPQARRGLFKPATNLRKEFLKYPYDYYSIMQYKQYAFARKSRLVSMVTRDAKYQWILGTGQKLGFSDTDILKMNELYKGVCKAQGGTKGSGCIRGNIGGVSGYVKYECKDKKTECAGWLKSGLCKSEKWKDWMAENCCQSCLPEVGVDCFSGNRAINCGACPQGQGPTPTWCEGECKWCEGKCQLKTQCDASSWVQCGSSSGDTRTNTMPTCDGCPQGNGAAWCKGDCQWHAGTCKRKGGGGGGTSCIDKNTKCEKYKKDGYCKGKWAKWMKEQCCKTCDSSGNGGEVSCVDKHIKCQAYKTNGYCTGKYAKWMKQQCCHSCQIVKVSCGRHKAWACSGCTQGNGASWCNGDCRWCGGSCKHVGIDC